MELDKMIFVRDYTSATEPQGAETTREELEQMMDMIRKSELFKDYETALNAIPKMIVPKYRATYDDLLKRLDDHTNRCGGKIHGEINYKTGSAWIEVILPFFEAINDNTRQLFTDVIMASLSMNFSATNDGNVRLYALLPYFEDLCDDETKDKLFLDELFKHRNIVAELWKLIKDVPTDGPGQLPQEENELEQLLEMLEQL